MAQDAWTTGPCWLAALLLLALNVHGGPTLGGVSPSVLNRKEHFKLGIAYPEVNITEEIRVDYEQQLIYLRSQRYNEIGGLNVLLHFHARLRAIRDDIHNHCFIAAFTWDFEEILTRVRTFENQATPPHHHNFQLVTTQFDSDVLRVVGAEEIIEHCQGVPSHWMLPVTAVGIHVEYDLTRTVDFRCVDGSHLDLDNMKCTKMAARQGRQKRAVAAFVAVALSGACH